MGKEKNLVMGAKLLCTKAKDSAETSRLVVSDDDCNNVYIDGKPAANRRNREVNKNIIPFKLCKKKIDLASAKCKQVIVTAELWENLTLPYEEVKVPYISWRGIYEKYPGVGEVMTGRQRYAENLNDKADEEQFLTNYDAAKKDNKKRKNEDGSKRYRFSDEELRRNAILKTKSDTNDACITTNSILLCLGHGGIIHPKTSGQGSVSIEEYIDLYLTLPPHLITPEVYRELARIFMFELDRGKSVRDLVDFSESASFISLCFDFKGEKLDKYFNSSVEAIDGGYKKREGYEWEANQKKIAALHYYMDKIVAETGYQDVNLLQRYCLFNMAQYIKNPTSEIGAGRPDIAIEGGSGWPSFPAFALNYKHYDNYVDGTSGALTKKLNPYTETVYRPVVGDAKTLLDYELRTDNYKVLTPTINGAIETLSRDVAICVVFAAAFTNPVTAAVAGTGALAATTGWDYSQEANKMNVWIVDATHLDAIITSTAILEYRQAVGVISNETYFQFFPTSGTADKLERFNVTHEEVMDAVTDPIKSSKLMEHIKNTEILP